MAYFKEQHGGEIPQGLPRSVTPAAADAWMTALENFGTKSFAEVVARPLNWPSAASRSTSSSLTT